MPAAAEASSSSSNSGASAGGSGATAKTQARAVPPHGQQRRQGSEPQRRPSSGSFGPKGLTRIKFVRKIVDAIIKRSHLEVTSLHIFEPNAEGLCARGKIRLTHMGTGPFPLVGLQVKFKDVEGVTLSWGVDKRQEKGQTDTNTRDDASNVRSSSFVHVHLDPLSLHQGAAPGSASSEVGLRLIIDDASTPAFVDFVRQLIRADPQKGICMQLNAAGVQVKAFGVRFAGLTLEKDVIIGGLGSLGGTLTFDDGSTGGSKDGDEQAPKPSATSNRLKISDLDITGGDPEVGIEVTASVTITNPAASPALIVEPGELRFALCVADERAAQARDAPSDLPRGLVRLGTISLAPSTLRPGANKISTKGHIILPPEPSDAENSSSPSSFAICAHEAGQRFLASILQNERVNASAIATRHDRNDPKSGVSSIGWLAAAFEGTRIEARIPPLGNRVRLLDGAEVRVEEKPGQQNQGDTLSPSSISQVAPKAPDLQSAVARATLRNSFGTDIQVHHLLVRACSAPLIDDDGNIELLELGTLSSPETDWRGLMLRQNQPTNVSLPMQINPDPKVLIEVLRKSAGSQQVQLGNPLVELLEDMRTSHWTEAGFAHPPKSRPNSSHDGTSRAASFDSHRPSFSRRSTEKIKRMSNSAKDGPENDLGSMLASALANLHVTAHIETIATIGNFRLPGTLRFEQRNLPIALSTTTAAALLPLVGTPFVKALVDRAEVDICGVDIRQMDDRGIEADITLRLTNFGPLSAQVTFNDGLHLHELNAGEDGTGHGRELATIHLQGPLPVVAGDYDPVIIGARIVPSSGPDSREKFSRFVSSLLKEDEITYMAIADPTSVTAGGVNFQASFSKHLTLDGLGGFPDLRLDNLKIVGEAEAPAHGVSLSVAAPASGGNPSAIEFTAALIIQNRGNLQLKLQKLEVALSFEGTDIGQASIDAVNLQAHCTTSLQAAGKLYVPTGSSTVEQDDALSKLSTLIQGLFGGEKVDIGVEGRRAWVAQDEIDDKVREPLSTASPRRGSSVPVSLVWLDDALRTFSTVASVQWKDGVRLVTGIDIGHIHATFAARKPMQLKIDSVSATYIVPFPISFDLSNVDATLDVVFANRTVAKCHAIQETIEHLGVPTADVAPRKSSGSSSNFTSESSAKGRHADSRSAPKPNASGQISLSMKAFDLQSESDTLFGEMISDVFQAGTEGMDKIVLRGHAQVKAKTALGVLNISVPLGIEHRLQLEGLDGLRHTPLRYDSLEIVGSTPKYVSLRLNAHAHNPSSSLTVHVPDSSLSLAAYFQGGFVGDVVLGGDGRGLTIAPGVLSLQDCEFRYHTTSGSEAAGHSMLSDLFEGRSAKLSIRGHKKSSVNGALAAALSLFDVPIEIAPLGPGNILERIRVTLGVSVVTSNSIDARYVLNNPTKLDIDVLRLEVKAFYRSNPFGTALKTYSKEGEMLPIHMRGTSEADGASSNASRSPAEESLRASMNGSKRGSQDGVERLLIPAGARGFSGAIVVKLGQPLDQLVKAFLHERGSIVLDVELKAKLDLGGYVIPQFVYRQNDVPLDVAGLQGVARLLRLV